MLYLHRLITIHYEETIIISDACRNECWVPFVMVFISPYE
jgi:hypothetical protein